MSLVLHYLEPVFSGITPNAGYLEPILQTIEIGIPLIALGMMILYYYGLNGWGTKAWDKKGHWLLFLLLSAALSATLAGTKTLDSVVKPIVESAENTGDPNFFSDQPARQATLDNFQIKLVLLCFALGALLFVVFSFAGKAASKHAWHVPVNWPRK